MAYVLRRVSGGAIITLWYYGTAVQCRHCCLTGLWFKSRGDSPVLPPVTALV